MSDLITNSFNVMCLGGLIITFSISEGYGVKMNIF